MEIKTGRQVIDIEIKALNLLKNYISKDFVKVVNLLLKNKGKIIVSGKHEELLEKSSNYKNLYEKQFKNN